ncbi:MAG: MetQ/NlpA family ABC transporter substrate-binding protein [Coriobacteriales bacterium]|jgi:D-methionine transport system substrate-binding protein|nr:MetQ/NlpA family ABC transporter substrate-binding protein [Coriobacteriales bacterium]
MKNQKNQTSKTPRAPHALRTLRTLLASALSVVLIVSLSVLLTACGNSGTTASGTGTTDGSTAGTDTALRVLKVGASPSPHAEILSFVKDDLKAQGIDLQVVEFTDYVTPNTAVEAGEIDANYFQHLPYLEDFNKENGTSVVSVVTVHFEPLGIYAGKTTALADLPDGAKIALPNDTTNEARALQLLAANGLITLPADADLTITPRDIVENPKNIQFVEVEAASVPIQLAEVDLGVINGNYALDAQIPDTARLASEDTDSLAAQTYANILAVKQGSESNADIQALIQALTSSKTRDFIDTTYKGVVVPVF